MTFYYLKAETLINQHIIFLNYIKKIKIYTLFSIG